MYLILRTDQEESAIPSKGNINDVILCETEAEDSETQWCQGPPGLGITQAKTEYLLLKLPFYMPLEILLNSTELVFSPVEWIHNTYFVGR